MFLSSCDNMKKGKIFLEKESREMKKEKKFLENK